MTDDETQKTPSKEAAEPLLLSASKEENDIDSKQREISAKEAYFVSLNEWVKHANISQNAMALFPWYLLSSYPQIFQTPPGVTMPPTAPPTDGPLGHQQLPNAGVNNLNGNRLPMFSFTWRILDERTQAEMINRTGGYEYVIAPFWKRAIAEMIDVLLLLLLKVMLTFTVMNIFDLDLGFDLDKEVLRKAIDDDDYTGFLAISMDFLAFSSDLLMLELLTKFVVCIYEAAWTTLYRGATPGKAIMNIRILHVEAVLPLQPQQPPQWGFQAQRVQYRALLYPCGIPAFGRAFMRAIAKNLIMTLLFPMCFIMIFFKNNRTAYDVLTKTIVVEANANPVLRRQR